MNPEDDATADPGKPESSDTDERKPVVMFRATPRQIEEFKIVRELGKGAMGAVYEAVQQSLDRTVALKVLHSDLAFDDYYLRRFRREGKVAAQLNHPGIVQVYRIGEENGFHFLAMEFVADHSLRDEIRKFGRLELEPSITWMIEAAEALGAAYENTVVHRDIKPDNILLTPDGHIKIADLGLAKQLKDNGSLLTASDLSMGTPAYIAPEQVLDARGVSFQADIYSLGICLFHMLTGTPPFTGGTAVEIMDHHRSTSLPRGADRGHPLPPVVDALLQKMCAKDPADRPESYAALVSDLKHILSPPAPSYSTEYTRHRSKRIAEAFLRQAERGTVLRLCPLDDGQELRVIAAPIFRIGKRGRSDNPDATLADFLVRQLPRNPRNDLMTRRVSGIHLCCALTASGPVISNSKPGIHSRLIDENRKVLETLGDDQRIDLSVDRRFSLGDMDSDGNYELATTPLIKPSQRLEPSNESDWLGGGFDRPAMQLDAGKIGCIRFAPTDSISQTQCVWLFSSASLGAGENDALIVPQAGQCTIHYHRHCFLFEDLLSEGMTDISGIGPSTDELIPLTSGAELRLGNRRYEVQIA